MKSVCAVFTAGVLGKRGSKKIHGAPFSFISASWVFTHLFSASVSSILNSSAKLFASVAGTAMNSEVKPSPLLVECVSVRW